MSKGEGAKVVARVKEEELNDLYDWISSFNLSRKIKNIHREFSDGVLMAELVSICLPKLVELHNYSKANSISQKRYNWNTLNQRVFRRLGFQIDKRHVEEIVNCKYMGVEKVLNTFKNQLHKFQSSEMEVDSSGTLGEDQARPYNEEEPRLAEGEGDSQSAQSAEFLNDEIVEILRDKIFNLEKLLKIKDSKIDILNRKIDTLNRMRDV
ncbi:hypothetical protein, conserved [Plasmodium vivax]|uniref:Calponin-homology (CH) domain-containing protein n=2 Tax=Plasmodium vivax TaxID=5855 RepID=A5K716_PLAVS|nr:hypothetical protein, conserved [Plasmodium vivax]EDL45107.1 hypothetical protein, conserved [Plasmodium vivax]KMZ87247.1 hypothetical protein PVBG_05238 [Plasmodium vivax Brazil I]|eukprot:XP_001614834.1 hypothetical protein [Plasmodium vivax Sal-1]